jgi:hypothetical protein
MIWAILSELIIILIVANNPYATIKLPIELTLPDGRPAKITTLRQTEQLPEATDGETETSWIEAQEGCLLTECVYDVADGQQACVVRLALDLTGDIAQQVVVQLNP